jgi:hypothetical protein
MYCPTCAAQITKELVYCPRCGANLAPPAQAVAPPAKLSSIAWAISLSTALITLGGFGMVFAFSMFVIERGIILTKGAYGLMFFFLAIILIISTLLINQLSRVLSIYKHAAETPPRQTARLGAPLSPAQLEEAREYVSSVTESPTRTFAPARREPETR